MLRPSRTHTHIRFTSKSPSERKMAYDGHKTTQDDGKMAEDEDKIAEDAVSCCDSMRFTKSNAWLQR